jgi:lipopolysaccharide transport system permease protein
MGAQDIGMRYRRSLLGPFWISLSMAALVVGLASIYGRLFDQEFHEYLYWIAASFLIWFFISSLITEGMQVAIEAEPQLRSLPIPIPVLAARIVYRNLIVFLHNAIVIVALMALFGMRPTPAMVMVIPAVAVNMMFGFCAALVLGPLCLRFRDVAQVIISLMQIFFFVTPIMWNPDQHRVPEVFVQYNPLYYLVEIFREPLLGRFPSVEMWEIALALVGVMAASAVITLTASRSKIFVWL